MLDKITATFKYFQDARAFLRHKLTLEDARNLVSDQFQRREATFLRLLNESIYKNPDSPYLKLLRHAGVEFSDAKRLVEQSGLEAALGSLHDAGVYVTQDLVKLSISA